MVNVGANNPNARLTEAIVREIRQSTETSTILGVRYGVDPDTIINIRNRKRWKNVP